jgi:hypothetical protein
MQYHRFELTLNAQGECWTRGYERLSDKAASRSRAERHPFPAFGALVWSGNAGNFTDSRHFTSRCSCSACCLFVNTAVRQLANLLGVRQRRGEDLQFRKLSSPSRSHLINVSGLAGGSEEPIASYCWVACDAIMPLCGATDQQDIAKRTGSTHPPVLVTNRRIECGNEVSTGVIKVRNLPWIPLF